MTSSTVDSRLLNRLQDRENDRHQGRSDHKSAATWRTQNDQVIARILSAKGNKQKLLLRSSNIQQFVDGDGDDEKKRSLKPSNTHLAGFNMLQDPAPTEDESRKKEERVSARKKEQQGNAAALNQPKLEQKVNISKVAVAECQDLLKRLFDALAGEEDELKQLRTQVAAVTERRNGISAQIASSQNRLQQLQGNHSASLARKCVCHSVCACV
jgi:hypothetical protein